MPSKKKSSTKSGAKKKQGPGPPSPIRIVCKCGDEIPPNYMLPHCNMFPEKKHGIDHYINTETGEVAANAKEAFAKGWDEKYAGLQNSMPPSKFSKRSFAATTTGRVLKTEVSIHPYVYETFVQSMGFMPEAYKVDDQQTFSHFILHLALFYRSVTNSMLPWGDGLADAIRRYEEEPKSPWESDDDDDSDDSKAPDDNEDTSDHDEETDRNSEEDDS